MLKARGLTVVMTTNYLDEADQLCDRLAIIDGGVIKVIGSPVELKIGLGGDIVSLTLKEEERISSLESALKGQPTIKAVRQPRRDWTSELSRPRRHCLPFWSWPTGWDARLSSSSITGPGWMMCSWLTPDDASKTQRVLMLNKELLEKLRYA